MYVCIFRHSLIKPVTIIRSLTHQRALHCILPVKVNTTTRNEEASGDCRCSSNIVLHFMKLWVFLEIFHNLHFANKGDVSASYLCVCLMHYGGNLKPQIINYLAGNILAFLNVWLSRVLHFWRYSCRPHSIGLERMYFTDHLNDLQKGYFSTV